MRVLGLTPLLALPLPLLLAAMGWGLLLDPAGTEMTRALGDTLARVAATAWFLYRVFHPRRGVLAALRHPGDYPLITHA